MSITEEQRYERKLRFFKERLQTCGYRFHNLIQTRRKEIPRLAAHNTEAVQQEVESRVLSTTDAFINCLTGDHYASQVPDYLAEEYVSPHAGPTLSRPRSTPGWPRGSCWRRSGSSCWRRSSRRPIPDGHKK